MSTFIYSMPAPESGMTGIEIYKELRKLIDAMPSKGGEPVELRVAKSLMVSASLLLENHIILSDMESITK